MGTHCEIALRWMLQIICNEKSILVQVMAWCYQATSHNLSQYCPRFMLPFGAIRPQRVKDAHRSALLCGNIYIFGIYVFGRFMWSRQQTHLTNPTLHETNIPQCTICNTMHNFVTEMCTDMCTDMCTFLLHNCALWDIDPVPGRICELGHFQLYSVIVVWWHQAITWTCIGLYWVWLRSNGIQLK